MIMCRKKSKKALILDQNVWLEVAWFGGAHSIFGDYC
jgi:hypothetical protein